MSDRAEALERLSRLDCDSERRHLRCWLGEESAEVGARALAVKGSEPWALAVAGRVRSLAGRFDEAADLLDRAAAALPREAVIRAWRGELAVLRREPGAQDRLDEAVNLDASYPWAYAYRAAGRFRAGLLDAAEADALRLEKLRPRSAAGPALLAVLSAARADRAGAEKRLARCVTLSKEPWVLALRGALRASWNELEPAREDLERALAQEGSPWLLLARAAVSNRLGEFWKALEDLERAEKVLPESPELHMMAASIHQDQAQYAKAAARLTRAAALAPDNPEIPHRRARAYFVQGRLAEAQRDLRESVRLSDGGGPREELVQLLIVRGYDKEAERELASGRWAEGAVDFWRGYLACRSRRYARAAELFARAEKLGGPRGAKAGFYKWISRVLAHDGPLPREKGRTLGLIGLGYRQPYQASVEAIRWLASCDVIYSNLSDSSVADFLGLFPAPFQAIVFRSTQQQADESAREVVAGFSKRKRIAMVTRGQPVVYGRLAWHLVLRSKRRGVPCRVLSSVSIFDTIAGLAAGRPPKGDGLQVLDACAVGKADPLRPAVVYNMPVADDRRKFLEDVASVYRPDHPCWLMPGSGENELLVEAATVAELPSRVARADPACTIYLPPAEAA